MAESMKELMLKISGDVAGLKAALGTGKGELDGFARHAKAVGDEIKGALATAGIVIGVGLLISKIKELGSEMATIGARTETLKVAMQAVGTNAGVSKESLAYFTAQVKDAGVTTQEAMSGITKFMMQGLPLDRMKELATRARDLAVIAGKNTSETLGGIIHGITTQQTEVLRTYGVNLGGGFEEAFKSYAATLGKTKEQLNTVERAQAALNAVMDATVGAAGAAAAADATVGKQLASLQRYAETAKESFFSFFGPIMVQAIAQTTEMWKNLEEWASKNKDTLREWGVAIGQWVVSAAEVIRSVVVWVGHNRNLLATLAEFAILLKVSTWIIALGAAIGEAYVGIRALISGANMASMAFGGWLGVLIRIAAVLAVIAGAKIRAMVQEESKLTGEKGIGPTGTAMLMGEGAGVNNFQDIVDQEAALQAGKLGAATPGRRLGRPGQGAETYSEILAMYTKHYQETRGVDEAKAKELAADYLSKKALEESQAAVEKKMAEAGDKAGKEKKGKAEKDFTSAYMGEINAQKKLDIERADADLAVFKATNETKKHYLEASLAGQLISADQYYAELDRMETESLNKATAIIEQKLAVEADTYAKNKAALEASPRDPRQKEAELSKLNAEWQTKQIDLEKQLALAKEASAQKEAKKVEAGAKAVKQLNEQLLQEEAAGASTEAEKKEFAILTLLEQQKKKREEINLLIAQGVAGGQLTPEQGEAARARLEGAFGRQLNLAKYGEEADRWANTVANGISNLTDSLMNGGKDLAGALKGFFNNLFKESLVPGFKALKDYLKTAFSDLFGSMGPSLLNAVMGVIGLIGSMIFSGGAKSSFSAAGVQSQVTGHESVRGIIAGEDTIPIAKVSVSLKEALAETNGILRRIEEKIGGGGSIQEAVNSAIGVYFAQEYQTQTS